MVGLKVKDIDKDVLMMFALSYEYSMSFTNLLKLFKISKEYFWTFMEICSPMLKMGVRKASMLKKSVNKIYACLNGACPENELNAREERMYEIFKWFLECYFSDGDGCLSLEQLECIPFAQGYTDKNVCIALNHKMLEDNIDRISYIKIGEDRYYKTSRILYYIEKYCGDLDFYQINNLSMKDMLRKIDEGEEKLLNAEQRA